MKRFGPFLPFQPWESSFGKVFYGGGDIGLVGAAGIYAASAAASWIQALAMPAIQAAANIELMNKQKQQYDQIVGVQRQLLTTAVNTYINSLNSLLPDFQAALPDVPQAAEYVPVDSCCVQGATIECNISHIERAGVYSGGINRFKEQQAIIRGVILDPNFIVNMSMISDQIRDLLRGVVPIGRTIDVLKNRAEQDALSGRIGSSRKTTPRDLGIEKLRMMAAGREEFRAHHGFLSSAISPISGMSNIEDMMQTPQQRVALALTQAQLIQNSLQNLFNRNAQKPPYLLAQLETKLQSVITRLQFDANKATLVNTYVPNYSAILAPTIRSVAGAIGDAIDSPAKNLYFGAPGSQDGFTTQRASNGTTTTQSGSPYGDEAQRPSGTPRGFI